MTPATMTWQRAERADVDRGARYVVKTNDGATELQSGHLLYVRLRPEFVVGRPVWVAKVTEPEEVA